MREEEWREKEKKEVADVGRSSGSTLAATAAAAAVTAVARAVGDALVDDA